MALPYLQRQQSGQGVGQHTAPARGKVPAGKPPHRREQQAGALLCPPCPAHSQLAVGEEGGDLGEEQCVALLVHLGAVLDKPLGEPWRGRRCCCWGGRHGRRHCRGRVGGSSVAEAALEQGRAAARRAGLQATHTWPRRLLQSNQGLSSASTGAGDQERIDWRRCWPRSDTEWMVRAGRRSLWPGEVSSRPPCQRRHRRHDVAQAAKVCC